MATDENMYAIRSLISTRLNKAIMDANGPIILENNKRDERKRALEANIQSLYEAQAAALVQHPVIGRAFNRGALNVSARVITNYVVEGDKTHPFIEITIAYNNEDAFAQCVSDPYSILAPDFGMGYGFSPPGYGQPAVAHHRRNYAQDSDHLTMNLMIRRKLSGKFVEELKACEPCPTINLSADSVAEERAAEIILRGGNLMEETEKVIADEIAKLANYKRV